jgi:hypothetical protein
VGNFVTVLKLWGFSHCLKTNSESLSVPLALVADICYPVRWILSTIAVISLNSVSL